MQCLYEHATCLFVVESRLIQATHESSTFSSHQSALERRLDDEHRQSVGRYGVQDV